MRFAVRKHMTAPPDWERRPLRGHGAYTGSGTREYPFLRCLVSCLRQNHLTRGSRRDAFPAVQQQKRYCPRLLAAVIVYRIHNYHYTFLIIIHIQLTSAAWIDALPILSACCRPARKLVRTLAHTFRPDCGSLYWNSRWTTLLSTGTRAYYG